MTEAARVSIAIEATGLEKTTGDMAKLEKAGEKAAASVRASMGGIEKNMAAVEAMFTKATSEIVRAVTKLDANLSKSFAGLETSMAKAMKAMQANTAPATAAVQQMQTSVSSDLMQIGVVADKMAEAVRDSMGGIAPAVTEASAAISRSSQAMGAFDTASVSMARSAAALETAVRGVAEMQAKLADQLARKPANDNPFQPQVKGADELRAKYDALFAIGLKYRKDVEEIRKSHEAGSISLDTMNRMIATAGERATATQDAYVRMNAHIMQAGGAAKLSAFQMQGLGYQINDMATMLALGASPFQIIASQAGQVVQVLGDHPGGMKGSLSAIGSGIASFARAIPAAGYVVAGLSAAVGALWYLTSGPEARKAEESVKGFEDAVKRLEGKWRGAADAAKEHYRVAREKTDTPNTAVLDTQAELAKLKADLKGAVNDLDTSDALSGRILRPFAGHVSDARREISSVYADLRKGKITADDAAAAMLRIRLDPKADVYARNFAEEIRRALGPVQELEDHVQALNNSVAQLNAPKGTRGRIDPVQRVFDDRFGGSDDAMKGLREGLEAQTKEMTEADKAAVNYTKTVEDQRRSIAGSVSDLRLQIETFGQSEGAQAAARMQADLLAEAERAAADAKQKVDPALIEFIKAQSSEYGRLTDQLDALSKAEQKRKQVAQALSDIDFDRSLIGLSDGEQNIRQQLRSLDVDFNSFEGQRIAAGHRLNDQLRATQEEMRRVGEEAQDAFGSFVDALVQGDSAMDALLSTFGRFGQQMASAGFDKLTNGFFGLGTTGQGAGININMGGGQAAGAASAASSIIAAPLAALNDNLQRSSTSALEVAKQFDGLNERADSKVLDGFLRASGNWKGLSAADTAWCASFANASIMQAGGKGTGSNLASSFLNWGTATNQPKVGDIVVLRPQSQGASGHVGFVAGFGDGKVQVFGGNQSGGANTKSFGLNQVAGYRTGSGLGIGDMTKAVSDGTLDATKKINSGAVPIPTARPTTAEGGIGLNVGSGMDKLGTGMQALGAGLGIFAQGAQSQSPIMGAVGGALGGFSAGAAMGAGLGPVGAVLGAVVGGIGGIFGKSKAKKAAQKQKWEQAEEAWQQNLPAFRKLEDEVTRTERGPLSSKIKEMQEALKQFDDLAKKGKGDRNNDQIRRVRAEMAEYIAFLSDNFIRDLPQVIGDLGKGLGTDTSFTKARDSVMAQADSYRGFMKDIEDAYAVPVEQKDSILAQYAAASSAAKALTNDVVKRGYDYNLETPTITRTKSTATQADVTGALDTAASKRDAALAEYEAKYGDAIRKRDEALAAATKAAQEGLLRIVSGDTVEQSDIEKAIAEAQGAASGLRTALVDLGMTADETAVAIDKALGQRMEKLRDSFTESLRDKIADLDGKGYLASVRDLIKQRDDLLKDASLVNVDTSLVDAFFTKQAQAFVDGAELTGGAFNDLIAAFPELTGKVKEFVEVITDETVKSGLSSFLSDRLADATSKRAEAESDLLSAYNESKDHLESYQKQIKDFLTGIRLSDDSPLSQKDQFLEAQTKFRDVQARAMSGDKDAQEELVSVSQSYLDEAKAYYASSENYFAAFNEVEGSLKSADTKATSQLDLLKDQVGSLIDISDNTKTIAEAITALTEAIAAQQKLQDQVDGGRSFGINKERNRLIDAGVKQLGLNFTGNYGLTNGNDEFLKWRLGLPKEQLAAVDAVINQYIGINKQMGGLIPGFANGGIIGNGLWNKDSVLARYQNGGSVALAGGEMVISAPKVTPRTYPVLDAINRTGMVPANENSGSVSRAEFAELSQKIDRLTAVVAAGAQMTTDEIRRGNQIADDGVNAQKKALARKAS